MGPYEIQCHGSLVNVAAKWLSKEGQCRPVLTEWDCRKGSRNDARMFSPEEPDAIGWNHGESIVVECKASLNDLKHDKEKWKCMTHTDPRRPPCVLRRMRPSERKLFEQLGYTFEEVEKMGRFRYILCPRGLVSLSALEKHAPKHGLLYFDGKKIVTVAEAPRRLHINLKAEAAILRPQCWRLRSNLYAQAQAETERAARRIGSNLL